MRKVILILFLIITAFIAYWQLYGKNKDDKKVKPQPIAQTKNSSIFNQSYDHLLNGYYSLKDALVADDTVKANVAASHLITYSDSLAVNEIKGDSTGVLKETALTFTATISGSSKALVAEQNIEAKRKEFEMITEAMWNISRVVKYDGEKIYYFFCPMAFNDKGAYWLSREATVQNPYFGKKMLTCGNVADSLDYRSQ
ncbi:MAG TPA: DUF3347 domain-containing protein [Flavitalea sp.]|nr:DUF3347 domain-containing protein [Flavitalea sp.]